LWRSVVRRDIRAGFAEFSRIGLLTTPLTLVVAVVTLWLGIRLVGI
jgi:arsenical pump membrane protein